jgi:hypothetical protein
MTRKFAALAIAAVAAAGAAGTAYAQSGDIQRLMDSLLSSARSTYVPNGWVPTRQPRVDFQSPGGTDTYPLQLNAGREYVFVGVCDADCSDLDLILRDARGNVLAQDTLVDDTPVVRYRARSTQQAVLNVTMASCSTSICYYQVGTFAPRQ